VVYSDLSHDFLGASTIQGAEKIAGPSTADLCHFADRRGDWRQRAFGFAVFLGVSETVILGVKWSMVRKHPGVNVYKKRTGENTIFPG
jgi:hypothetical protein